MVKVNYEWQLGCQPPVIQQHSIAKHEILRAYLLAYLRTLVSSPAQEVFRLTLVDGFAGGGVYKHAKKGGEIIGSPFVMLQAVKEAEFLINKDRHKKVRFLVDYFFIEQNVNTFEVLKHQLNERGYGKNIGDSIHLFRSDFLSESEKIFSFIRKKGRAARAIFLLDQYGYSEVPITSIANLLYTLPGSEVIFTFSVDSFINYASDNDCTIKVLNKIGLSNLFRDKSIEEIKKSNSKWRLFIQSSLYQHLVQKCGAKYYTPFFIRSSKGHGDYWLLHFSQQPRARDVMTRIHWDKNNYFIHYGDSGLDMFNMLGYDPNKDEDYTGQLKLFCFDDSAQNSSVSKLQDQIPRLIYPNPEGVSLSNLFSETCNSTPASLDIYRKALGQLIKNKQLEIVSPDGKRRRSAGAIHDKDRIMPPRQRRFIFNKIAK
ncbi:three-Cys-motif partner protein TcmP [Desulfurivibrio alkaliphilus]|uniref:GMT-like wHTH domain-containing protein n=1 Tax=Desulfurivibrio alkaliphilus (strain DSM 19089 / UNIQEM U267 / AHT2) TaxID=589865 RepID=D6Z101_DESAT|nr:three-Cys-motif partner protein TcmP [Desulfurivibrio alkaliphilus]ADH87261.1 conserved hypothetical protein [Desulfurivibrio alkaliphilus AHT 2]